MTEPRFFLLLHGIILPIGLITNLVSLIFIKVKLKINYYVHLLLMLATGFKLTFLLISSLGYFAATILNERNLYTCSAFLMPILAGYTGSFVFPGWLSCHHLKKCHENFVSAAIAVIRFHMASAIASQKSLPIFLIRLVIGIAVTTVLTIILILLVTLFWYQAPLGLIVKSCYDSSKDPTQNFSTSTLMNIVSLVSMVIGIAYDISMGRFLKKRRTTVQQSLAVPMVAWGSPPIILQVINDM